MITEELQVTTRMPRALRAGTRLRVGQVIDCVGGGSTGHVYRVIDDMGTHLAVREYFPPEIAMRVDGMVRPQERCDAAFQAGLKLFDEDGWQLAAQDHPGLLKVQQVWTENGTSYLSMPWCEGHTLKEIVRSSPMPPSQAQLGNWLRAMADALTLVHRRRGLHGNLSPGQVVLLDSGRLLVMEFGRARRVVTRDPREIERDPFAALECGTDPRCGPSGPWTDVYALAAMLFFVLRGRAPQSAVRRAAFDAQEPLTLMAGADYTEQFLSGIDAGLVLRPRARPQSLPEFLAGMGLRERRARQRATGESLLGNLPVADAAPPRDEVIDLPLDIEPEAPVEAAAEVHLQTPADAPVEAPAEPPIAAAPDPGLAPATVAHAAAMPEPAPDHAPAAPAAPATAPVAAAALEPAPAPVVAAPPSTQEATAAPVSAPVSAPVATPTAASKETSVEPQPQPQPNARPKTPTPPRAAKAAPTTPVSARSEQAEPVPSAQPAAPVAADQPVLTEIVEPPGPARAAEAPAKPAVPPPVQADRADRRAAPSVARDRARPAQAERRAPRPSPSPTAPAPVPEPAPWPESAWPVSEAEASAAVAGYAKLHRRTQRRSGSAGAWAGLAGAAGMAVLLGVWWLQGGPGRPSSSAQVAASQAAPAAEASRAAQVVPPPSAALAAAEAGASSPIPDPLEPTAAGPSASQPVDAAVQPAPAASPEEPAAANVRDPVGPEAAAPAASVEPAAPAVPALQEAPRSSNARVPAPAPARASPKPRAVPSRQPADEAPAASPNTTDSAADTADPSSRCPDLLARQYTGRPLSAAEREQLRAHCR